MKPKTKEMPKCLKCYYVTNTLHEYGDVVFAVSPAQAKVKWEESGEHDYRDLRATREKRGDCYAPGPVPDSVKFNEWCWTFPCEDCESLVTNDDPEYPHWMDDSGRVHCGVKP